MQSIGQVIIFTFLQLANILAASLVKQRLFTLQNIYCIYCTLQKISYFALTTEKVLKSWIENRINFEGIRSLKIIQIFGRNLFEKYRIPL